MTYQQHLGEWDIPLSEPSCFSYSHTLKALQCLFLFNNDVACTVLGNNALLFEKNLWQRLLCIIWILYHSQKKLSVPINIF